MFGSPAAAHRAGPGDTIGEWTRPDRDALELCVEQVRRALIGHLGTTTVEAWLGKDGAVTHDVVDLATVAVRALAPALDDPDVRTAVTQLHADGRFASPITPDPHDW